MARNHEAADQREESERIRRSIVERRPATAARPTITPSPAAALPSEQASASSHDLDDIARFDGDDMDVHTQENGKFTFHENSIESSC